MTICPSFSGKHPCRCAEALLIGAVLLGAAAAAQAQHSAAARTTNGETFAGRIEAISPDVMISLADAAERRPLAADDLVRWGTRRELSALSLIVLAGGQLVAGEPVAIADDKLVCSCPLWGDRAFPLTTVAGVILRLPLAAAERDRLVDELLAAEGRRDRIVTAGGSRIEGLLTGFDGRRFTIDLGAERTSLESRDVTAVVFNPSLLRRPPPAGLRLVVGFRDGTYLTAAKAWLESGKLTVVTPGDTTLVTHQAVDARQEIVFLQTLGGRAVYLSDLEPASYRHVPFLSLPWPFHADRNARGGWLRSADDVYHKGLGVHSYALLAYQVPPESRRLEAEIALDAATGQRGSVVFRVYLDVGDGAWTAAYESPLVSGGQPPRPISVPLEGARRVSLIVDFGQRGGELDLANWLDARFVK